jgi:Fe-S-cluster-containing dehydrogenase component
MKKYELVIDNEECWGCKACEVACKQEHNSAEGVKLISVSEKGNTIDHDIVAFVFQVNTCRHCDDPPCREACPEDAISKRDDGIVVMDYELCIGCGVCIDACPYDAIDFDTEKNIAQKCNFCHTRVDQGLMPACADNVCLAYCISFLEIQEK